VKTRTIEYQGSTVVSQINKTELEGWAVRQIVVFQRGGANRYLVVYER
jgi:hypothetical protein